jgi:hypothetical protein
MNSTRITRAFFFSLLTLTGAAHAAWDVTGILDVASVWAGHPVGFALLTEPPHQYVAYYDAERRMTVTQRTLDSDTWTYTILPETIGWDSHNYITMTLDRDGYLHLAGNMHSDELRYFRSTKPHDASTLERVSPMIGTDEVRTTYPKFMRGPGGDLIFHYRSGHSGDGFEVYNVYDPDTRTWKRLLDQPLIDGEGDRNAYMIGPQKGPDGYYHLVWVWRDTYRCETNHSLSYARSKNLVDWERSDGTPIDLPITLATGEVVDPVPPGGGMINGNTRIGFDHENRVVLTYHKYDDDGNTQVYNARREADGWKRYQATDWDYRWAFSGGGTIHFEVGVSAVHADADGTLTQQWRNDAIGSQRWQLDPETLKGVKQVPMPESWLPEGFGKVTSDFPGMRMKQAGDNGTSGDPDTRYVLRWETLPSNRDAARDKPWPEPVMLQLYSLARPGDRGDNAKN